MESNIFTITDENDNIDPSVCICDDTSVYYPCSTCGKYYDDELEAALCCLE